MPAAVAPVRHHLHRGPTAWAIRRSSSFDARTGLFQDERPIHPGQLTPETTEAILKAVQNRHDSAQDSELAYEFGTYTHMVFKKVLHAPATRALSSRISLEAAAPPCLLSRATLRVHVARPPRRSCGPTLAGHELVVCHEGGRMSRGDMAWSGSLYVGLWTVSVCRQASTLRMALH